MVITKDTQLCISIAEHPGNFGATVLNAGFRALGLDFVYKPLRVNNDKLVEAIGGIRSLGIRGCGVSMPYKISVIKYLDEIDEYAGKIGAVNTIVNDVGVLRGYNTDFSGAKTALQKYYDARGKKVLIIGAGGVARAIIAALQGCGAGEICLTNRDESRGRRLAEEFGLTYLPYTKKEEPRGNLLINATPVGMMYGDDLIIGRNAIASYEAVMDVVVSVGETSLVKSAKESGLVAISGLDMSLYQAAEQFKLYTGRDAPLVAMSDSMKKIYGI